MKKLSLYVFLGFLLCGNVSSKAENLMSWGLAGGYCSEMNKLLDEYGEEVEGYLESAIQGFLTGANTALVLMDKENEVRNIGERDSKFIINHIKEECEKDKAKGEDQQVWPILGLYFDGLPYFNK